MKKVMRILVVLVVVIVALVITAAIYIDVIARHGVEQGAGYALGVPTSLDNADVGITSGKFAMDELNVDNPGQAGFETPQFLHLGHGDVAVSLASLRQDIVRIPTLTLSKIDIYLEKKDGKANHAMILENLQKLSSGEKQPAEDEPDPAESKKFIIEKILVQDVAVHLKGYPVPSPIRMGEIQLENIGSETKGAALADVTGIVLREIFNSLLAQGSDVIGGALAGSLEQGLAGLDALGDVTTKITGDVVQGVGDAAKQIEQATQVIGDVGKNLGEAGKGLQDAAGQAGKVADDAGKAIDDIGKGLGGMFGGDKKPDDEQPDQE